MNAKFFIVSQAGYILPVEYNNYETACENCEIDETVFLADDLADLERCLDIEEEESF